MNLSETIQDDFNKIFKPENIEYPYSLMDVLQVHTQSNDQNKLYSYLHGGLEYMFDNSSLYMSSNKKKENSFFHSIADMFIFVKNTISKDSVKQNISVEIKENVGWSPTSSEAPIMNKTIDDDPISLDSKTNEEKPKEEKPHEETVDNQKEDDESFYIITYRKQKYYRDNKNKVYEIMDDEDVGKCIGSWVKQTTGKFKLVKS